MKSVYAQITEHKGKICIRLIYKYEANSENYIKIKSPFDSLNLDKSKPP